MIDRQYWQPYFKVSEGVHDSGWRVMEVGYVVLEDSKVIHKKVLTTFTDIIHSSLLCAMRKVDDKEPVSFDIHVTLTGECVLFACSVSIGWFSHPMSSAMLEVKEEKDLLFNPKTDSIDPER